MHFPPGSDKVSAYLLEISQRQEDTDIWMAIFLPITVEPLVMTTIRFITLVTNRFGSDPNLILEIKKMARKGKSDAKNKKL